MLSVKPSLQTGVKPSLQTDVEPNFEMGVKSDLQLNAEPNFEMDVEPNSDLQDFDGDGNNETYAFLVFICFCFSEEAKVCEFSVYVLFNTQTKEIYEVGKNTRRSERERWKIALALFHPKKPKVCYLLVAFIFELRTLNIKRH